MESLRNYVLQEEVPENVVTSFSVIEKRILNMRPPKKQKCITSYFKKL